MQRQTVIQLQSLKFSGRSDGTGGPILLRDPRSDQFIGEGPQWTKGVQNQPAAYVRSQTPSVEIGLQVSWFAPVNFTLSAWGPPLSGGGEAPSLCVPVLGPFPMTLSQKDRQVRFITTGPVPFNDPLPDQIGRHLVELDWYADWTDGTGASGRLFLGHTSLVVCTTWAPMVASPGQEGPSWAYVPLMEWSSAWCRGATSPKQICDLLMKHLPATGLQYGVPGWDIRSMLVNGGGMCGGWAVLFIQLANCQGVALSLATMMLPAGKDMTWGGLILTAPGLNQVSPAFGVAVQGHYRDTGNYPPPLAPTLQPDTTSRYSFGQDPDGHSVAMLQDQDGTVTIYDPSFQIVASQVQMSLPPSTGAVERYPSAAPFRTLYFGKAVPFLMDQRDKPPGEEHDPLAFGVTVSSPAIPEMTIVWNKDPTPKSRDQLLEKLRQVVDLHLAGPEAAAWQQKIQGLQAPAAPPAPTTATATTIPASQHAPVLQALEDAEVIPMKYEARVPHSMPPSELVQHVL
ncbi:MAG TPA: hypothetical protein VFB81_18735, partial [Myxococcales bacterium]|nr:hypothetical protein [Myxococcales bacterium]